MAIRKYFWKKAPLVRGNVGVSTRKDGKEVSVMMTGTNVIEGIEWEKWAKAGLLVETGDPDEVILPIAPVKGASTMKVVEPPPPSHTGTRTIDMSGMLPQKVGPKEAKILTGEDAKKAVEVPAPTQEPDLTQPAQVETWSPVNASTEEPPASPPLPREPAHVPEPVREPTVKGGRKRGR